MEGVRAVRYFNFIVAIILTILYALGKIPPSEKYNLWLTSFLIPFGLAVNILFLIISLVLRKKSSLYYVVVLIIGSDYLMSSIGFRHFFQNEEVTKETFRVLSYNINSGKDQRETPADFNGAHIATDLGGWIISQEAEIQCYQEFTNLRNGDSDLIKVLHDKGYYTYFSHDSVKANSYLVGTLITSKYPIIKAGDVLASANGFNRITYADLKISSDTLRVVNVHLESMGLKVFHPAYTSGFQSGKENTRIIFNKLKVEVFERSEQIKILAKFIESAPHAVVCVGDFNELPYSYSYSYQFMRKRMKNAFEQVGKGFGFTYNGNILRVLRIDNQFYSQGVRAVLFNTRVDVKFTDHFPIEAMYKIHPLP